MIISAIADPLVYVDRTGTVKPALAVSWTQVSPVTWRFELRRDVRFHDGAAMSADDVVATFAEHLSPSAPTVLGRSAFSLIKACRKLGAYEIELETLAPDNMLLRRLCFSQVYSHAMLAAGGREAVRSSPGATGGVSARALDQGPGDRLAAEADALGRPRRRRVDPHPDPAPEELGSRPACRRDRRRARLDVTTRSGWRDTRTSSVLGDAAISHFFLSSTGPLANLRVRKAPSTTPCIKPADRGLAEHGHGRPQSRSPHRNVRLR